MGRTGREYYHCKQWIDAGEAHDFNIIHITHRDEVEAPFVDWLREAYDLQDKVKPKAKLNARRSRRISPR